MAETQTIVSSQVLSDAIVEGMQENKAKDIKVMDLRGLPGAVCDFFVICSGDSKTQVDGISQSIQRFTRKEYREKAWHVEGDRDSDWILLDYVNVVAHIFTREGREFYEIEELWADAKVTHVPDVF